MKVPIIKIYEVGDEKYVVSIRNDIMEKILKIYKQNKKHKTK